MGTNNLKMKGNKENFSDYCLEDKGNLYKVTSVKKDIIFWFNILDYLIITLLNRTKTFYLGNRLRIQQKKNDIKLHSFLLGKIIFNE